MRVRYENFSKGFLLIENRRLAMMTILGCFLIGWVGLYLDMKLYIWLYGDELKRQFERDRR